MIKFKTHFCLVSAQAAPNLLPLLDETMKPEKVVLLVTERMQKQAEYLAEVIKPRGIKVELKRFEVSDNYEDLQDQLIELIKNEASDKIALNATGGTKWMAIASQEVFRINDSAVFYVKIEDDKVLFLDKNIPVHNLSQSINLKNYINAYGYQFRETSQATGMQPKLRELCDALVINVDKWQSAIGQLNWLASEAERKQTLSVAKDSIKNRLDPNLETLLNECKAAEILTETSQGTINFTNEEAREFANGGWLEAYVASTLNGLKSEGFIQDKPYLNLHITKQDGSSHNEVDVCFMAANRLHLIECKSKRMSGPGTSQMTTDTIYKMDSISELGGLASKSMLVSYRDVNREADINRAKALGIKIIAGSKIQNLKSELRSWIKA